MVLILTIMIGMLIFLALMYKHDHITLMQPNGNDLDSLDNMDPDDMDKIVEYANDADDPAPPS